MNTLPTGAPLIGAPAGGLPIGVPAGETTGCLITGGGRSG